MRRALLVSTISILTILSPLAPLCAQPRAPERADIYSQKRKSLTGRAYYVVIIHYENVDRVAVEVRAPAGGKTQEQRAEEIVKRMKELQRNDPAWAEKTLARKDGRSGQWVVASGKDAKSIVVATADQNSVRPMNCKSPRELAQTIHTMVRNTYHFISLPGKFRSEKMHAESLPQDWVTQGDTCLDQRDIAGAIKSYSQALTLSPHYAEAELRLASIYADIPNKNRQALSLIKDAAKQDLDPEQKLALKQLTQKLHN